MGQSQALVHDGFESAGVVHLAHGVGVRHLGGLNKVLAPQGDAVDTALPGGLVHQALHVVNGFRATCAAVSAGASGVGHHPGKVVVDGLNVIDAALHPRPNQQLNGQAGHARVGAHIGFGVHAQRQDFAFGIQRQSGLTFDVAAMRTAQKVFAAIRDPAHRTLQLVRAVSGDHIFGVGPGFHAKAAADITHNHTNVFGL